MCDECDAQLLETLLHTPSEGYYLLSGHLDRLLLSGYALGFTLPAPEKIAARLHAEAAAWPPGGASRVRLLAARDGSLRVERYALAGVLSHPAAVMAPPTSDDRVRQAPPLSLATERSPHTTGTPQVLLLRLDPAPTPRDDPCLRHKTTARAAYDAARERAAVGGEIFDVLMHNELGQVTETSITNVGLEAAGGGWITPPLSCGLLGGVMRAEARSPLSRPSPSPRPRAAALGPSRRARAPPGAADLERGAAGGGHHGGGSA